MSAIRFDGRVALVTGAGGGLGRSHALLFGSRGAKVVVNDLGGNTDGTGSGTTMADQVVAEIKAMGGDAVANYDSVDTWEGGEKMMQAAVAAFGRVDIVVNNAGILRDKSIAKMTEEEWTRVLSVHLNGSYYVTRAALPVMRQNNYGRIVFTTSAAGLYGNFGQANYSAAKLGIVGLMNTVKLEGRKANVLANTIAPIAKSRLMGTVMDEATMEKLKPEFVSAMVAYLCSEENQFTGGIFTAGGGHYARAAMVESPGVTFGIEHVPSVEEIASKFTAIADLTEAKEYESAGANVPKIMAGLFPGKR
jgi:NAD(P)-dependent dehydrogenase (short-subunit alcohol dehydrogenase family)